MNLYHHHSTVPRSTEYSLRINDQAVEVLFTDVADFAICALTDADFPATVEVIPSRPATSATVHPTAKNIPATTANSNVRFTLSSPEKLSIGVPGNKPFYLFANPPEVDPPAPGTPNVVTFAAGQIHEVPLLNLEEGDTLYLPGGAVFKGRIHIKGRSGIRICGHGLFDGSLFDSETSGFIPFITLERCSNVLIEDITMVRPQGWMLLLAACSEVSVHNIKQIGEVKCSDGIDIVGSRDVLVEDCFLHNNDDCIAIKAFHIGAKNLAKTNIDARENVQNIRVRSCTFANWHDGNAMEIGHELSVDVVQDVAFEDIDVLHVHGTGAVFSLHNNDRARIDGVLFKNIRIEHCYDKLIDFRVSKSRFSTDSERGSISNVTLRDIYWHRTLYNAGYTISLIGGRDERHMIENVLIENFFMDGKPVHHLDELEIHTRHCRNLRLQSAPNTISEP